MKFLITSICLLAFTSFVFSQNSVSGTIIDGATGAPLQGATVYIVELNKATSSDASGRFTMPGLKSGVYRLTVSFLGYQEAVRQIRIDRETKENLLNIGLTVAPVEMNEVVVSGAYVNPRRENTYNIAVVQIKQLQESGAVTVMDLLEKVPGIDAVTTGPMVSRPVIRGLSGNRVLTVVDGARFETQQWDDEHGIGVNELGVGRIEVIKGPASLLYGPEAMGGVLHFVPEQPVATGTSEGDAIAALYSNNLGFYGNVNVKGAKDKFNWGANALGRLLSDYFYNGYNFRVPNTRVLEYGGKGYAGVNGKWGSSRLSYTFNKAYYGILDGKDIIRNDQGQLVNTDSLEKEKFPFETEAPFHTVTDNRINLKTVFLTGASKLETLLGYQINRRSENEELSGSKKGYTYLDMRLQTATYDVKWYLPKWHGFETITGVQGMFQKNKNIDGAATRLIPDATINDLGFLALSRYRHDDFTASLGARYDSRHLETSEAIDASVNLPAISRNYDNISASAGVSYLFAGKLLLRASYASGYRSPNLNELMSDGVKLESQRYEKGNADFKKETNNQADLSLNYTAKDVTLEVAAFYNRVNDFIYIAPTGNMVPGITDPAQLYPEYEYLQSDAEIKGGEFIVDIHPAALQWVHFESKASTLRAIRKDNDSYLPMMPATKLSNTVFFRRSSLGLFEDVFFNLGTATAFRQEQVADDEAVTPGYTLLNAALGAHIHHLAFTLTANNILDKEYLDHLSRFRPFEIVEPGLNVSLSVKIPLDSLL